MAYSNSSAQRLGWATVMHVCRQWRQVALEDASLWNKIEGVWLNRKWFPEVLSRSKQVPIDITHNYSSQRSIETIPMISQHFSRVRALIFKIEDDDPQLFGLLRSEAPILEELTLTTMGTMLSSSPAFGESPAPVELKLFDGQAPRLRKICLNSYRVPWIRFPKLNLTHLEVTAEVVHHPSVISGGLDQLVKLLTESGQALEVLSLDNCLHPPLPQATPMRTVELPHLRSLRLIGSSSCLAALAKLLETPTLTKLYLHFTAEAQSEIAQWPEIAPIAFSHFGRTDWTFQRLYLDLDGISSAPTISASRLAPFPNQDHFTTVDDTSLELKFYDKTYAGEHWMYNVMRKACAVHSIADLSFLQVHSLCSNFDANQWARLFQPCVKVTTLEVYSQRTDVLLRVMTFPKPARSDATGVASDAAARARNGATEKQASPPTSSQGGHDTAHAEPSLFPQLTSLYLIQLDLTAAVSDAASLRLIDLIRGLIKLRESWGVPIKKLGIRGCTIPFDDAQKLKKLVPIFHWDGIEGFSSGDEEGSEADYDSDYISD
ncbi:hypothetical protein BC834DRAFT_1043622 [Gloeopeniophorella convolvens]|nr:hypothetical protein BC834DRAFT_1043622 [Gloeopeniophorella convolvens]